MTPRELALMADGYRWRERRDWEHRAVTIAYLLSPYPKKGGDALTPQDILDALFPGADETRFEQVAGLADAGDAIDAMVKRQQERTARGP